jgi:hypothetical protein
MVASVSQFQTKVLRRERAPDEYRLYCAALEWGLLDPIVIESRKDFKSEYRWRDQIEPFHHQVTNLITFCRRLPVTLLADDVGLGKTISAGLVASELISRSRISKILVVCPKLLGPQWQDELQSKFNIPAEVVAGKKLIDAEPEDVGAIITTYASARLYLDQIPDDRFEMLVLDEAHKLRNLYGVEKPPQVAVRFREALEKRRFRYVLMLTATPIQNRLWDLYSLVDLLTVARGHANPFGSEGMFARKFIADNASDDAAHSGGQILGDRAVSRHGIELRHQRVWAAGQRKQDGNLRQTVEFLDGLGQDADQLQLFGGGLNLVQLHDPFREIQLGVTAAHARHIAHRRWSGTPRGLLA